MTRSFWTYIHTHGHTEDRKWENLVKTEKPRCTGLWKSTGFSLSVLIRQSFFYILHYQSFLLQQRVITLCSKCTWIFSRKLAFFQKWLFLSNLIFRFVNFSLKEFLVLLQWFESLLREKDLWKIEKLHLENIYFQNIFFRPWND